jgi:hypothetical protein
MATATAATITDTRIIAAWNRYLEQCRETTNPVSYAEVEPWAWSRLQQKLKRYDMENR